jgi:murein DD-endopeptidase MepM/ murein hydrolase activator NlpD
MGRRLRAPRLARVRLPPLLPWAGERRAPVRLLVRTQQGLGRRPAVLALLAAATVAALDAGAVPSPAASPPTTVVQAQHQLSAGQQRVAQLAGTVTGAGQRAGDLGTGIAALQGQVSGLQRDLTARRSQLLRVRDQLDAAQRKLGGLEAAKAAAEHVLAEELVGSYEGDHPDIVSVVLEANGFQDLLERLSFAQRVERQDALIVGHVRSARRAVATEAKTLGQLTARAQVVADRVLSERNQVARSQLRLVAEQLAAAKARATAAGQLASAQVQVDQLTQQLARLQAAQPATPTPAASRPGTGIGSGTSGGSHSAAMPFPVPAGDAAPPATWSLGQGVNIAVPAGTPELAVCTGTVVLHGIGGLGPSAPVLRCDQPLDGHSDVYYGFAGPTHLAAVAANVAVGQPIARVGDAIIGTSTGPHLEIGFADASGTPLGATAARQMLTLLRAAYAT